MKVIIYAGGEYMTGDDVALALMEYSRALAEEITAETVEIPILERDGSRGAATFLVGPASQIVAKDVESEFDELIDPVAVTRLQRLTAGLHLVVRPETSPEPIGWVGDGI